MNDPIRYTGKTEGSALGSPHWEHPEGEWVKWGDYAMLKVQLQGARQLVKHLKAELLETKTERDKLAGIGIECGCGEASCTTDADNLRDALALIRRLKYAGDALAFAARHQLSYEAELANWRTAKEGKPL